MTFNPFVARRKHPLTLALACCLMPMSLSCAQTNDAAPNAQPVVKAQAQLQPKSQQEKPRALWVWDGGVITQSDKRDQLLTFAQSKNIGILYLHLGDFLSPTKRDASDPKHVTAQQLGDFLEAAHAKNLRVEALDGDPSFTREDKHADALQRLERSIAYNRTATPARRLDGFQWDIEPYVLKEFKDETQHAAIVGEFLDIVKKSRDMVQAEKDIASANGFWLGFALPFWMDGDRQSVTWNGEKRPATFHVLHTLSTLPHAYVALMAYRDKGEGTISAVRDEIDYAAKNTPNVLVVVGQETGAVKNDPPSITFYEEGEGPLETALTQINTEYAASPVYGGIAIHHLDSYRDLIARLPQTSDKPQSGEASLTLATPTEGGDATLNTEVTGKASGGANVQLSVKPEGDIWYDSAPVSIAPDGTWKTSVRLGNDKTPAGRRFAIRARLLNAEGTVLQEKQISVARR